MLLLYVIMPHAAFGLAETGCICVEGGLKCGQARLLCHCCDEESPISISGTVIAECSKSKTAYSIAHPPAALGSGPVCMATTEPETLGVFNDVLLYETTFVPPLRPPEALPLH